MTDPKATTVAVKVSTLTGAALDWSVAQAVGVQVALFAEKETLDCFGTGMPAQLEIVASYHVVTPISFDRTALYKPSTDWSQGGPLVEKHIEQTELLRDGRWCADSLKNNDYSFGDTLLVAVCRAIVAAKLGETVEVPAVLMGVSHD